MSYLDQLGDQFSITLEPDENGYLGRECPECERYFKITPGTGLTGRDLPCHCPYCGHSAATKAEGISFQNLAGAQANVQAQFGFDLAATMATSDWATLCRCFQKRHLLAHSMGIIDEAYVKKTSDPNAALGRKVPIRSDEVAAMLRLLTLLGTHLANSVRGIP